MLGGGLSRPRRRPPAATALLILAATVTCCVATCRVASAQHIVWPLDVEIESTSDRVAVRWHGLATLQTRRQLQIDGPARVHINGLKLHKPVYDRTPIRWRGRLLVTLRHDAPAVELDQGTVGKTRLRIRSGGIKLLDIRRGSPAGPRKFALDASLLRTAKPAPRRAHERLVLAFYYGWWGRKQGPSKAWLHWRPWRKRMGVPHVPTLGYYDSLDPKIIAAHIQQAKRAGIDGFVLSWWSERGNDPKVLALLLQEAARQDFRISIYLERARDRERLRQRLAWILKRFGDHGAFLRADGRPVLFFYDPVHRAVDRLDMRHALQGLDAFFVAGQSDGRHLARLDAMHVYYIARNPEGHARAQRSTSAVAMLRDAPMLATATPGYDDRLERRPGFHRPRAAGQTYDRLWRAAWQSDWVLLVSWNEWHEGSQLEPSKEYGGRYLDLTRRHRARWLGQEIGLPLAVTMDKPDGDCTPVLADDECPPPWRLPAGVRAPKLVRTIGKLLAKVTRKATVGGQEPFKVLQIRPMQTRPTDWLDARGRKVRKTQGAMVIIRQAGQTRCLALPLVLEAPRGRAKSRLRVSGLAREISCSVR